MEYDLQPLEGESYGELFTALEAIGSGGYWDCLDATGLATTDKTAAQMRNVLKQYLKADRLVVIRSGAKALRRGYWRA